jgi:hypothetical protein
LLKKIKTDYLQIFKKIMQIIKKKKPILIRKAYIFNSLKKKFKKNLIIIGKNKLKKKNIIHNIIQKLIQTKKPFMNENNKNIFFPKFSDKSENFIFSKFNQIEFFFKKEMFNLTNEMIFYLNRYLKRNFMTKIIIVIFHEMDYLSVHEQSKLFHLIFKNKKRVFFICSIDNKQKILNCFKNLFFFIKAGNWKNFSKVKIHNVSFFLNILNPKSCFFFFEKSSILFTQSFFINKIFNFFLSFFFDKNILPIEEKILNFVCFFLQFSNLMIIIEKIPDIFSIKYFKNNGIFNKFLYIIFLQMFFSKENFSLNF